MADPSRRRAAAGPPRSGASARSGRAPRKRRRGKRRILRKILLGLVLLVAMGVAALVAAYLLVDIPEPNDRAVAQASVLYYSDGETEMDRIATVNREAVEIDQVPKDVQHAFLAAEDRSFYENRGVSPKGLARAVSGAVAGEDRGGGSTITQQYVKNYFLTQDQTYSRKAKELLISVKIDRELSKDEILENYLNTIYFGRGADGIQTAAEEYFGKDVEELTASEGAVLASVIRGPSLYDPSLGEQQKGMSRDRWEYVLDGMVDQGWLTPSERAEERFPTVKPPQRTESKADDIGFITEEVRSELRERLGMTDAEIDRGGHQIVTTIDKDAQKAAAESVQEHRPTGERTSDLHIGLASIEPGDGAVRAMYGGERFGIGRYGYFNSAVDGKMQAGSTMKPFTMIAALRKGIPLSTVYSGASPYYNRAFTYDASDASEIQQQGGIVNYGDNDYGPVDMTTATRKSINTYYAQLNLAADPKATAAAARDSGVIAWRGEKQTELSRGPGNVFGTDSVRVIDMANAYATIAAEGKRARPYYIAKVTGTGDSDLEYTAKKKIDRAYPQDVARDAIQAMSHVGESGGTGYPTVGELDRPVGGKTGTTSDNYAAWFDGYTPGQLATAVGMYKGDGSLVKRNQLVNLGDHEEITGGTIPASIWTDYMREALEGEPVKDLPPPGDVEFRRQTQTRSDAPAPITSTEEPEPTQTSEPAPTSTVPPGPAPTSTSQAPSTTSPPSEPTAPQPSAPTSSRPSSSAPPTTSRPPASTSPSAPPAPTSTTAPPPPSSTSRPPSPEPTRRTPTPPTPPPAGGRPSGGNGQH